MDRKLLLLINQQWTSPALDRSMAIISSLDLWAPFLLLALMAILVRGSFSARAFVLVAAVAAGLTDGAICNPVKHLVGRPRPFQALSGIRKVDLARARPRLLAAWKKPVVAISLADPAAEGRSFPSSHVANTAAAAVAAFLFFPAWGWLAFAVPLAVAWSRIYVGAHWPSDVAASLFLGAATGMLLTALAETLWRRHARRWWPAFSGTHPSLFAV